MNREERTTFVDNYAFVLETMFIVFLVSLFVLLVLLLREGGKRRMETWGWEGDRRPDVLGGQK